MNKLLKIAIYLTIFGIVSAFGTYLYVFHKPHRNIEKEKPAYIVDAQSFYDEFSQNETESYEKYGNQVVQVDGNIVDISILDDQANIVLLSDMEGINCAFDSLDVVNYSNQLQKLSVGDEVVLKGQCDGYDMIMGIVLTRCVLIE